MTTFQLYAVAEARRAISNRFGHLNAHRRSLRAALDHPLAGVRVNRVACEKCAKTEDRIVNTALLVQVAFR